MTTTKTKLDDAAEAVAEEKAPVRRTRIRRKTLEEAATVESPAVELSVTETPSRKRRVVRKKTTENEVVDAAESEKSEPPEQKPVRRTQVRKASVKTEEKEAALQETSASGSEVAAASAQDEEPTVKSRRRATRTKKVKEVAQSAAAASPDIAEAAQEAETPVAADVPEKVDGKALADRVEEETPRRRRTMRRPKVQEADAPQVPETVSEPEDVTASNEAEVSTVEDEVPAEDEKSFCADKVFDPKVFSRGKKAQKEALKAQSEKLQKVLADAGLGSRRDMEQLILEGRISVNGTPAFIGQRVMPTDVVKVNGRVVKQAQSSGVKKTPRVLAYHKPVGEIVSMDDPEGRPTVFDHLPKVAHGRWIAVGRLDFNTEGLLLFTTSGELANRLMHPRYAIEREYAVRAAGELTQEGREALVTGVELEDGPAAFSMVEEKGGEGLNRWYLVRINEGRNREVRRMFAAVGLTVSRLIRVRYGAVQLPKDLERGCVKELPGDWVRAWMADLEATAPAAGQKFKKKVGRVAGKGAGKFSGQKPGVKKPFNRGNRGSREFQRIPDPMTSTVNYIASGQLDQAQRVYSRGLADNAGRGARDFGRGDGIKGNRRFNRGGRGH